MTFEQKRKLWNRSVKAAVYAASILTAASFLVFTLLVKNIKAKKVDHVKGLDALGADD